MPRKVIFANMHVRVATHTKIRRVSKLLKKSISDLLDAWHRKYQHESLDHRDAPLVVTGQGSSKKITRPSHLTTSRGRK